MEKSQELIYEMLVGLNVVNDEQYQEYRDHMTPILYTYGGGFGYDFKVSETLLPETGNEINRVFTINFPSKEKMEAFFLDEAYQEVKGNYFMGSVENTTIIAKYLK